MKCAGIKDDGSACKAYATRGTEYCIWHDPEVTDEAKQALRSKGGNRARYQKRPPSDLPAIPVDATEDMVIPVFQRALAQLEDMHPSPQALATIGNIASGLDRAIGRREARGADVTRIEVEYINDWRED